MNVSIVLGIATRVSGRLGGVDGLDFKSGQYGGAGLAAEVESSDEHNSEDRSMSEFGPPEPAYRQRFPALEKPGHAANQQRQERQCRKPRQKTQTPGEYKGGRHERLPS